MEKLRADLHVHTYYSDGLSSPDEVVSEALKNGVQLFSVTDHDCSLADKEISALCKSAGIKHVKGIEVSAYSDSVKVHTLGYNFDETKSEFSLFLKKLYDGALVRAEDIVGKLRKNSVDITMDEVLGYRKSTSSPVHVMHIARACALKGYCGKDAFRVFSEYLAPGKCAYSQLCRPTPEETVEVISACGGFCSLAHPGRIDMPSEELLKLIKNMKVCGLGGIEAVYSAHTITETAYYKEIAKAYGLVVTGGSDTHYNGGYRKIGTPVFFADEVLAEKLGI